MKIALLGDTHFGVRNDARHFHEYYEKFYTEVFFPYLEENKITTIIQLGDLFDRRKYINFFSLAESRRYFFDECKTRNIHLHALIGNHDIFWRNSLEVNSPELLLKDYENITLWSKHGTLEINGAVFDMIPWICSDNEKDIREFITNSNSPYCIGHFELLGYLMQRGQVSHEGYDDKFLESYDQVYSGHYHSRSASVDGKIEYLGTPYELFWSDYKDPKGFGIFDTHDKSFNFVQNPNRMFYKITYTDALNIKDLSHVHNKYVKVIVVQKTNPQQFDAFLDEIYKMNPIDVNIIEDMSEMINSEEDTVDQAQDTLTILSSYIDQQSLQIEPQRLKTVMRELYLEALSLENVE